jgi:hypothetical protein
MSENDQRSRGQPKDFKLNRGGVSAESGPFVGTVVNNVDPTRAGRLQVYIETFSGPVPKGQSVLDTNKSLWRTVRYLSPFYGSTPPVTGTKGAVNSPGKFLQSNPHSYGMWFTPPDLGVQVLCFFAAGDPSQGYYLGCIPEPGITHMVPAVGASAKYKTDNATQASLFDGADSLPVTEINPNNKEIFNNPKFFDQIRPVHSVVAAAMFQQGTLSDTQRGPIGSTSQRESPSACYGLSTPGKPIYLGGQTQKTLKADLKSGKVRSQDLQVIGRMGGHSLVMDDGDIEGNDSLVRLRTATGHQITMSDDGNFLYIIHANGQTWLEFGQEGTVDVYATNSVNVRTQGTINLHADKDVNIFAGGKFSVHAGSNITMESNASVNISSGAGMTLAAKAKLGIRADGSLALVSASGSWNAGSAMSLSAGGIDLNGAATESVEIPEKLPQNLMPEAVYDSAIGWSVEPTGLESTVTRAPTHEPWPYHNGGVAVSVAMEPGQPSTIPGAPDIPSGVTITAGPTVV